MTPSRPYLTRAIYEWIIDNNITPYIKVDATVPGTVVPEKFVKNGTIIFNISSIATKHLRLGNDAIEFQARFGGNIVHIYIPLSAVIAIFAHETNRGMIFGKEDIENYTELKPQKKKKPHLTIVK